MEADSESTQIVDTTSTTDAQNVTMNVPEALNSSSTKAVSLEVRDITKST